MQYASRRPARLPLTPVSSLPSVLSMLRTRKCIGDRFITVLAVWMVAVGAVIPALDRDLVDSAIAIEAENHESCGHLRHDHTFCMQFGKQDWTRSSSLGLPVLPPTAREAAPTVSDAPPEFLHLIPTHSRAPPHTT